MTARETLAALAAHFAPEAISWRAGPVSNGRTKPLAYIDARDVQARLDAVMGADWQCEYIPMPNGTCCCRIGLLIDGQWRWRSNGAGETKVEADKGQYSDAFKRAAVMWGVGTYLYNVDAPWVSMDERKNIAAGEMPKLHALLARQPDGSPGPGPAPEGASEPPRQAPADPKAVAAKAAEARKAAAEAERARLFEATSRENAERMGTHLRALVPGSTQFDTELSAYRTLLSKCKRNLTLEHASELTRRERNKMDAHKAAVEQQRKEAADRIDPDTGEIVEAA